MRRRARLALAIPLLTTLFAATGCGSSTAASAPQLTILDPHTPAPVSPDIGVLYFTVRNAGGSPDTLLSVTTDVATSAEVHREVQQGREITMLPAGPLSIPAHTSRVLAVGGTHVMLVGLTRRLTVGEHFVAVLHFRRSPPVTVTVPVVSYQTP